MRLNPETLERLLIDRSLGAIAPDVSELIGVYLKHDAGAAGMARELDQTAVLARQSLSVRGSGSLPSFPAARLKQARRLARGWSIAGRVAMIAAGIVLGLAAGSLRYGSPTGLGQDGQTAVSADRPTAPVQSVADTEGFWSARRLYERRAAESPNNVREVVWKSPIARPRLRGAI